MVGCDARTQGAPIAALSARPRTRQRARPARPGDTEFILIRALSRRADVGEAVAQRRPADGGRLERDERALERARKRAGLRDEERAQLDRPEARRGQVRTY